MTDPLRALNAPMFEVQQIPGKGKGLVALTCIPKGTRILLEKPLLTVEPMETAKLPLAIATKLNALPKDQQRQFFSLQNSYPQLSVFVGVFKTNALPCGSRSSVGGIYPTICLINHSCLPNAHNNWNPDAEHETIHAVRPIEAGEEITIEYDHGGPSAVRQAFLKDSFGFECKCSVCSLEKPQLQASDARRRQIQELDNAIGDPFRFASRPEECLRDCHSLLQALEEEGLADGAQGGRLYYDAFQVCVARGDQARASVFAERAYQARVLCEGEDSPLTQRVKSLAGRPADHASFELCSTKWRLERKMVPKGLDPAQFNKWLFKLRN